MTPTPRTAAGRALLADFESFDVNTFEVDEYRKTILAIEAQAATPVTAALDVERLARAVATAYDCIDRKQHEVTHREQAERIAAAYAEREKPDPLVTYTDPAGGPDWEPRRDEA